MSTVITVQGSYKSFLLRFRKKNGDPSTMTGAEIAVEAASKLTGQKVLRRNFALTFLDANVAPTTDYISVADHGLANDDKFQLTTTGVLPAGLALLTDYYVKVIDKDTIQLSLTPGGSAVNITAAAGGGTHSIPPLGISFVGDPILGKCLVEFKENATLQAKAADLQLIEVQVRKDGKLRIYQLKNALSVAKQSY